MQVSRPPEGLVISVACSCGNEFEVRVDQRFFIRVLTSVEGSYEIIEAAPRKKGARPPRNGTLNVVEVSLGGFGFVADDDNQLQEGDRLQVEFSSDALRVPSVCNVEVLYTDGRRTGAKICS